MLNNILFLIFSIASGFPFGVIVSVYSPWLKDLSIDLALISFIGICKLSYSFKFLWAPLIDKYSCKLIRVKNSKKSWMIFCYIIITIALYFVYLIHINKTHNNYFSFYQLLTCSFVITFASATYDICFDGYRINFYSNKDQARGVSHTIFGYRIGMLITSSFVLSIAHLYSWSTALLCVCFISCALLIVLILSAKYDEKDILSDSKLSIHLFLDPIKDLLKKDNIYYILSIILLFKLGESLLSSVITPFYMEVGFNKMHIAFVQKLFGFASTTVGLYIGAYLYKKLESTSALIICGILMNASDLIFIWQNYIGPKTYSLFISISVENITWGMGTSVCLAYQTSLCSKNYTSTHYAILTAVASFSNNLFSSFSGAIVNYLGWNLFFITCALLGAPSLFIAYALKQKDKLVKSIL